MKAHTYPKHRGKLPGEEAEAPLYRRGRNTTCRRRFSMLCVVPDLLKWLSCMVYTMFLLQAEEREDTITGYMKIVKSAIESVPAMRSEDIVRNGCKNWGFLNELFTYSRLFGVKQSCVPDLGPVWICEMLIGHLKLIVTSTPPRRRR